MWSILSHLLYGPPDRPIAQRCAFCGLTCGRVIRECAEAHGGRKALKDKIRELESERAAGNAADSLQDAIAQLFVGYLQVSWAGLILSALTEDIVAEAGQMSGDRPSTSFTAHPPLSFRLIPSIERYTPSTFIFPVSECTDYDHFLEVQ